MCFFRKKDMRMATAVTSELGNWQRFINRAASLIMRYSCSPSSQGYQYSLGNFRFVFAEFYDILQYL
jgi:hypothetical protein